MSFLSEVEARAVLGNELLGATEVTGVFGAGVSIDAQLPIPFSRDALIAAREAGEMLVLRIAHTGNAALTIQQMINRFPDLFDKKLLRQVGYQLKDEWGIELEPLAATDTCAPGWALVGKEILADSRNLPYDDQDATLRHYAERLGGGAHARRRSAVEAVYDTVLAFAAHQVRLLEKSWDWSASRTVDGGYLTVGGFGVRGMQIIGYSKACRHGALGVCPTRQRNT